MPLSIPQIFTGPAAVTYGGATYYFSPGTLRCALVTADIEVPGAYGELADVIHGSGHFEVSGTPVGQVAAAADLDKIYPVTLGQLGRRVCGAGSTPLVVHEITAGVKWTFARSGVLAVPNLRFAPDSPLFTSEIRWGCPGNYPNTQPDAAGYFYTLGQSSFTDTSYDPAGIIRRVFSAAYGNSPYNAMIAHRGFGINFALATRPISVSSHGLVDWEYTGLDVSAQFAPANLTEAQQDTLLNFQGTGAFLPGQSRGKAGTDLVLTSDWLVATLKACGPSGRTLVFGNGDRYAQEEIVFRCKGAASSGALTDRIEFTDPA